jgi:hypothetical protein
MGSSARWRAERIRSLRVAVPAEVPDRLRSIYVRRSVLGRLQMSYLVVGSFVYYILAWPANRDLGLWMLWLPQIVLGMLYLLLSLRWWAFRWRS